MGNSFYQLKVVFSIYLQAIPGIPQIAEGYNPATWMLEVSNIDMEIQLGVDFAELYLKSSLYE